LPALAISGIALFAYIPAMGGGFIWDDDAYVTENLTLTTVGGLARIWLEGGDRVQYYPLTLSSFWLEYRIWALSPVGYHVVNVLLHGLGSVLLWLVLRKLAIPGAWVAGAIFAVHPVHVESVAWITERKNVLSGVFYLASMLVYLRFAGVGGEASREGRRWRLYAAAFVLFVCALLSKTVTCSLPAALALLLWWKRKRLSLADVVPLIPMLFVGLVMGLTTAWIETKHVGAAGADWELSGVDRCLIAGRALWFYTGKLLWPTNLTFIYPRWQIDSSVWWQYAYPVLAVGLVIALWVLRGRGGRGPLVAALFFGGTLFPALGFINVFPMRYSFVADHFQYLASIGPITLLAALGAGGCAMLVRHGPSPDRPPAQTGWSRAVALGVSASLLLVLGALTWQQGRNYRKAETLWRDTLAKNPSAWMAHNNLAVVLSKEARYDEAIPYYREALRLKPDHAMARTNLGTLLSRRGKVGEAESQYREAIRINPRLSEAYNVLGALLVQTGRTEEGISHLRKATSLRPTSVFAHNNLGMALARTGKIDEAMKAYRRALELNPRYADAHCRLGNLLAGRGLVEPAVREYEAALRIDPGHARANEGLSALHAQLQPAGDPWPEPRPDTPSDEKPPAEEP
jgi:tetratricopeptide (TPR) repeat protein